MYEPPSFQQRVVAWLMECFPMEVCRDRSERNHRFLEESLELVQSLGCTRSEAHQLVDYVFDRPAGDPHQELGGVMVTTAALCWPNELDMEKAAETELARVWQKIDVIRAKQAVKPKHSPLPAHAARQTVHDFLMLPLSQRRFIAERYGVDHPDPQETDLDWSKRVMIAVSAQGKQSEFAELVEAAK